MTHIVTKMDSGTTTQIQVLSVRRPNTGACTNSAPSIDILEIVDIFQSIFTARSYPALAGDWTTEVVCLENVIAGREKMCRRLSYDDCIRIVHLALADEAVLSSTTLALSVAKRSKNETWKLLRCFDDDVLRVMSNSSLSEGVW